MKGSIVPAERSALAAGLAALALLAAVSGCEPFSSRPRGRIRVVTQPEGATLYCNGILQEASPTEISGLDAGMHLIVATLPGYREIRQTVEILKDQRTAIHLTLEPLLGLALVESDPPGADVTLDGAWRGKTPFFLNDLPLGVRRFEFSAQGHLPRELEVTVEGRRPEHVRAVLTPNVGSLAVRSQPEGAEVLLNGVPRGVTPTILPDVPAGENKIEIRLEGYLPYTEQVVLSARENKALSANLEAIPSRLTVVTLPEGARLYIGDQYRGETPITLTDLPVGQHRVRVELRGYDIMARFVSVAHNAPRTEEFRLAKNSGKIVIVSEPAGAAVFLNGQNYGVTPGAPGDPISGPLELDLLPPGEYRIQLTRSGFLHTPRLIRLAANEVADLHEKMTRRYVADTRVRLRGQAGEFVRDGMLIAELPNGDIELQFETGTIQRFRAEEILSRTPLRAPGP